MEVGMSESRAWILDQLNQGAQGIELPGPDAEAAEAQADEPTGEVELPAEWPDAFWNALTDEAQQEARDGTTDLSEEWAAWSRGEVDTGPAEPDLPTFELELPMSGDECQEQARLWDATAAAGGDEEASVEEALAYADAWRVQARATMIEEERLGRRQAYTLEPPDERAAVQRAIDERVAAGKARWGER